MSSDLEYFEKQKQLGVLFDPLFTSDTLEDKDKIVILRIYRKYRNKLHQEYETKRVGYPKDEVKK